MELIVFIKCSGPNVNTDNLKDTLLSFHQKNKDVDYKFYLVIDAQLLNFVNNLLLNEIGWDKVLKIELAGSNTWPQDFNIFFEQYKDAAEWLLISHDDTLYITDNWFKEMIKPVLHIQESIGWMTSTNEAPTLQGRPDYGPRPGHHKDHENWPWMFDLHNQSLENRDLPKKSVMVHGVFSCVMLIPMKSMKIVGPCENWSLYTMLIDEDWSLRALQNNLKNVWVPNVKHLHWLRPQSRKVLNRYEQECHQKFENKWGYKTGKKQGPQGCSIDINDFREQYKDTLIPWSSYRNSYDWDYIDE
tara:strand:+ start:445 stop:1347 length:903 start_codon:yes stop_codon:yes gene_type:complete